MRTVIYYEDSQVWRDRYAGVMSSNGYRTIVFANNLDAERATRQQHDLQPDIAVLDIRDQAREENVGFRLGSEIRRRWPNLPIIFLTTYDQGSPEELKSLQLGANYFINKAKDPGGVFLLATLENLLAARDREESVGYSRGSLTVDKESRSARWKGREVDLTATEFLIVDAIAQRSPAAVPYERIRRAAQIQEPSDEDLDYVTATDLVAAREKRLRSALHTHIRAIRKKFEAVEASVQAARGTPELSQDFSFRGILATEHDVGYRWKKDY
jgi:DNA-binding response OmpR family regulator